MNLTDDQIKIIEEAGKNELPVKELAILLDMSPFKLENEFEDETEIFKIYQKAKITSQQKIMSILTEKAENGDKEALKAREKFLYRIL